MHHRKTMSASGPIMFGFASTVVRSMLEAMPESRLCTKYLRMEDERANEESRPRRVSEVSCKNLKNRATGAPKPKRQTLQKRSYNSMFSEEEDEIILKTQRSQGSQNDWKSLSKLLKNKTPQQVQSRWYGCLRKRVQFGDDQIKVEFQSEFEEEDDDEEEDEEEPVMENDKQVTKREVSLDILMETALLELGNGSVSLKRKAEEISDHDEDIVEPNEPPENDDSSVPMRKRRRVSNASRNTTKL
jgi:hypothetical protein